MIKCRFRARSTESGHEQDSRIFFRVMGSVPDMAFRREDRIASGNGKGGMPLSVYYVGGSSFVLVKDGEEDHPLAKMTLKQVKKMISEKKVTLLRPKHLEEIENEVDPETGDTESHNADGSTKSTVDQMLSKYEKEGYIVDDGHGGVSAIGEGDTPQPRRRRRHRPQPGSSSSDGQNGGQDKPNGGAPANADKQASKQADSEKEEIDDVDPFADIDTRRDETPDGDDRRSTRHKLSEYDDNDASFDTQQRPRRKKSKSANPEDDRGHVGGPLFVFVVATVLICLVLFFGSLIVAKNIFHGQIDEKLLKKNENTEQTQDANKNDNANSQNGNNENEDVKTASGLDSIKRTDFDPEDAVKKYTMASSAEKQIADGFMKQIRSLIAKGDVNSFTQMVALDNVSSEIAISYADLSQVRQNLTDDEKAELLQYYKNTLVQQERKHVTDKDLYASMFGGRVREVRQQAGQLYVVMESIGGDHQRACFVLTEDSQSGSWALTDIVDTNGYVKMIGNGDTSQYVQDLKTDNKTDNEESNTSH